ncbi:GNAT family N-acetyltransferase [Demequina zhanjiangensis]|uniref:GNAT family N-acetyltransferase n=1 Tax=Demequina zhanjiangensis TaxID=3051659 RepID=A0ABT8G399_9MICO|nr:GNAT family N-acetyltransferase [Demequina sp. SYSU T00b26]MDN4473621.1 GNAT family N-acetyltransferase [Demequina sp. SYSU T00b26]
MTWDMPHTILTDRLELRRYREEDAAAMSGLIPAQREHLLPFLTWAEAEPVTEEARAATVTRFMDEFDSGKDFTLGIFDRTDGTYLGGTGLHTRLGEDALEIGYWIRSDRQGEGLVSETASALARIALELLGAEWVEIRCEPANTPSHRVPERLGFTHMDTRVDMCGGPDHRALVEIWQLRLAELGGSLAGNFARPRAFDAHGQEISWPSAASA